MQLIVRSHQDLDRLRDAAQQAAEAAQQALQGLVAGPALEVLYAAKFREIGQHPVSLKPLNLIEQLNQTFTALVTYAAVEQLTGLHPAVAGWRINLGARPGTDIESIDGDSFGVTVAAEVFAAVRPSNNDKLRKDIERVGQTDAANRYVFFHTPEAGLRERAEARSDADVSVVGLELF